MIEKHFVTFFSPGTFVAETTTKPVDSWDVAAAQQMAAEIKERYNATPYAFQFSTRTRAPEDLDSHVSKTSPHYYLGGKVETLAEIKARATKDDATLIWNMEANGHTRVITTTKGWRWTQPLSDDDIVLDEATA